MLKRLIKIGDALSQLGNTALLLGHPNESISGRSFEEGWRFAFFIDLLFSPFQKNHCESAYRNDLKYCKEKLEKAGFEVTKKCKP